MNRDYILHYTPLLLRSAAIAYIKKLVGPVLPVIFSVLLIYAGVQIYYGNSSWKVGLAGGGALIVGALLLSLFISHVKHAETTAHDLSTGESKLGISESGIRFSSPLGVAEIPWAQVSLSCRYNDFVLLLIKRGNYTSIPLESIDDEALEYLEGSIVRHGGKIA